MTELDMLLEAVPETLPIALLPQAIRELQDAKALLREARGSVYQHKERLLDCDHEDDCTCDLAAQKIALLDRIDAALVGETK